MFSISTFDVVSGGSWGEQEAGGSSSWNGSQSSSQYIFGFLHYVNRLKFSEVSLKKSKMEANAFLHTGKIHSRGLLYLNLFFITQSGVDLFSDQAKSRRVMSWPWLPHVHDSSKSGYGNMAF